MRHYHNSRLLQTNCYILPMIFHKLLRTVIINNDLCYDLPRTFVVVDIIMFTKCFVVFITLHLWHEFLLCASRAGTMDGLWLVQCWAMVGTMSDDGWCNVGPIG